MRAMGNAFFTSGPRFSPRDSAAAPQVPHAASGMSRPQASGRRSRAERQKSHRGRHAAMTAEADEAASRDLDPDQVALLALQVWTFKQGEVVSLIIHLGDRLGLYRAMDGAGPLTAVDLAARTGLHRRWMLEWLRSQAAARLLDSPDGEVFELTPEAAAVLAEIGRAHV